MRTSRLTTLSEHVQRIEYGGMHVDIVRTARNVVRIGSMPDIVKFLGDHDIHDDIVVVPDWEVSMAGDNRTGEEFVLWSAEKRNSPPKTYVGTRHNVTQLHAHLERIFPYFFDEKRLSIVKTDWLDRWFHLRVAEPEYTAGGLSIRCEDGNVTVSDNGVVIYSRDELKPVTDIDAETDSLLRTTLRDNTPREHLEVMPIGCGNGLYDTPANTIVRFGDHVIWIDPCGYPAHTLSRHNIHWDDITHFLFTHNHEDHIQGFTACLARARKTGWPLNLLMAENAYELLMEMYTPLFPDLIDHVNIQYLQPGTPLVLDSLTIESRWNHHILPYGTIGLKFTAGGKSFGYSGDTKYDETLNSILKQTELSAQWFAPCDLVFHEIDFENPDSVHTHWKQLEALQRAIAGKVLGYHTSPQHNTPFPLAQEGKRYILD
ncbi:MAG: hypothetical protein CL942_07295 [Desulfovibrio sp.]|nr:hypothetical protein [Desulfovibrio sp.]